MIVELPVVILIISISIFLFQKKKRELDSYKALTETFKEWFSLHLNIFPSIHQFVTLCGGNQYVRTLYCIVSLSKDFCLSQLFLSSPSSQIVITGYLKSHRPNFYVHKNRYKLKHAGLSYSKKYLLNTNKDYQVYGVVNNTILDFISKYDVDIFYCSYVPKTVETCPLFESNFYLRGSTKLLQTEGFLSNLMKILEEDVVDTEKRINEIKKKHMLDVEKFREEEKLGFFEKLKNEAIKKTQPVVQPIKKNKK
ncbi:hypothetical protein NGRA_1528 [Nosema granulosis]|uniref:Uncharacterized protein n=1 Tax=Nosema granulosis TaxID=83296 RepID=A0A9P6KZ25_9MICR|nr:hypothetical protein NGRA_1528 [Nosema granulosis]